MPESEKYCDDVVVSGAGSISQNAVTVTGTSHMVSYSTATGSIINNTTGSTRTSVTGTIRRYDSYQRLSYVARSSPALSYSLLLYSLSILS